nr:hypothetical protein [uncultured Holophaga sp.]
MNSNPNPKAWSSKADIPMELRSAIAGAAFRLGEPQEAEAFKATMLEAFAEVADLYLEKCRFRWAMEQLKDQYPDLPMNVIFAAVGMELGVSTTRLRDIWYETRRTRGVLHLVQRKGGA